MRIIKNVGKFKNFDIFFSIKNLNLCKIKCSNCLRFNKKLLVKKIFYCFI
jgi:hypothetical protein